MHLAQSRPGQSFAYRLLHEASAHLPVWWLAVSEMVVTGRLARDAVALTKTQSAVEAQARIQGR